MRIYLDCMGTHRLADTIGWSRCTAADIRRFDAKKSRANWNYFVYQGAKFLEFTPFIVYDKQDK